MYPPTLKVVSLPAWVRSLGRDALFGLLNYVDLTAPDREGSVEFLWSFA